MTSTEIPVDVQLFQAYPNVLEMVKMRGFDVSNYPPLSYEYIQTQKMGGAEIKLSPIPPIVVEEEIPTCFGSSSREHRELAQKQSDSNDYEFSTAFMKQYPAFVNISNVLYDDVSSEQAIQKANASLVALENVYNVFARKQLEVHFHQCFNPENLWGANSRDKRFMNEMHSTITSLEATARDMFAEHVEPLKNVIPEHIFAKHQEDICEELVALFKKRHTYIFLYRTRSKASSTLDKKYEHYCLQLIKKHGIFVQLFNLRHLMFNVTEHEMVPKHEALDLWHDGDDIAQIKRVYNMTDLAKENPVIALSDPVAKFIGLKKGQLCKITRVNPSSGTYVSYRWCK